MSYFKKIWKPVHIVKFEKEMADVVKGDKECPIYYIRTREGLRMIDETMYIATKSDSYRHPMSKEVFEREYEYLCEDDELVTS